MPRPKLLSSIFKAATSKLANKSATATTTDSAAAANGDLKKYLSSFKTSSKSAAQQCSTQSQLNYSKPPLSEITIESFKLHSTAVSSVAADLDETSEELPKQIQSILCGDTYSDSHGTLASNKDNSLNNILEIPWLLSFPAEGMVSMRRKEVTRDRKQKWVFKKSQVSRFDRLVKLCGHKLGLDATLQVFGKLNRETGLTEYNALLAMCIEEARETADEEVQLDQNYKVYQLFQSMRELGFQIEEETYGPFLEYLIDYGMVPEFYFFCDIFKHESTASLVRLAYYEMRLCIKMNNEDKIQELLYENALYDGEDKSLFQENYLLALCESDRRKELLMLLETFDLTKVSSVERIGNIFRMLGKLLLESHAEKFLLVLKTKDAGAENMSDFICNYVVSIPNLVVEDVVTKFKQLHSELEVKPTSVQYEKLIKHSCEMLKGHVALDIADEVLNMGFTLRLETFHSIMSACEKSCEYNLVCRIYSMIQRHGLKPDVDTFRNMIHLSVKMKDFEGAYNLIKEMVQMNLSLSASIYNAIMAGFFREKNIRGALMVLRQMEDANVEPDAQTFSYLIVNCSSEEEIIKIFDEMKHSGIPVTRNIFMALINAYAACGQFEKAKQVVLDKRIPDKNLNEIKSVLVSALASHGKMSDALAIYEEIKQDKCNLEPKAAISLIEHIQSKGQLHRLLQLLQELQDPDYWVDGCYRVIAYCVTHNHLRSAIDLLKQIKDAFSNDEVATGIFFDEVFCQFACKEPKVMKFGLGLLQAIKEELGLQPSRKSLDFLLSACISANDIQTAFLIWKEYRTAELPYNVLSFVRMYQTLLALGNRKAAANILNKIPKDDPHVCSFIKACQTTYVYSNTASPEGTKTKTKKTTKKMTKKKKKRMEGELLSETTKTLKGSKLDNVDN